MAAAKPTAVAIRASAMPGATAWMLEEWVTLSPLKAFMMPHTVPNKPINGAALAVVAKKIKYFSSLVISTLVARFIARDTFSTPPSSVVRDSPEEFSFFVLEIRTNSS